MQQGRQYFLPFACTTVWPLFPQVWGRRYDTGDQTVLLGRTHRIPAKYPNRHISFVRLEANTFVFFLILLVGGLGKARHCSAEPEPCHPVHRAKEATLTYMMLEWNVQLLPHVLYKRWKHWSWSWQTTDVRFVYMCIDIRAVECSSHSVKQWVPIPTVIE